MNLSRLTLRAFRNVSSMEISFAPGCNVVHGSNAQGKTNLLEAIYLLGTLKSFRMARNAELIQWGSDQGFVRGEVENGGGNREIALLVEPAGKTVKVDGKAVTRMAEFAGCLTAVVFFPEEIAMVRGMPEVRRRYLDRAIFTADGTYLSLYHDFHKILRSRNLLLRNRDLVSLEAWSVELSQAGARLQQRRIRYVAELAPLFSHYYRVIAGNAEDAALAYRPHRLTAEALLRDGQRAFQAALEAAADDELERRVTLVGPHRDDLEFRLGGRPVRHSASQGQQRSLVLALKMAEIEYLQRETGTPPLLLLDDMTSELDRERNANLMAFLQNRAMQVFITTTRPDTLPAAILQAGRVFRIEEGTISCEREA